MLQPVQKKVWGSTMASIDILMSVCTQVDSVQQLAMLCSTSKALKTYLYSEEGGKLWLNVARRICGDECWSETDRVKDGRYEAMVRLCPWLGERSVERYNIRLDYSDEMVPPPKRIMMVRTDVTGYASFIISHPGFNNHVAMVLAEPVHCDVKDVHIVHGGVVALSIRTGIHMFIAFFATSDFRLLKVMPSSTGPMHFSCGRMSISSSRPFGTARYASSAAKVVPALQNKSERWFCAVSNALKEVDFNGSSEYRECFEFGFYRAWCSDTFSDHFPDWNITLWPGFEAFFGKYIARDEVMPTAGAHITETNDYFTNANGDIIVVGPFLLQ